MANERPADDNQRKPLAENEKSTETKPSPAGREDAEKIKKDEALDDRFQATDN